MEAPGIPVIDFSEPNRQQNAMNIAKAMEEVGFMYLDNIPGYTKEVEAELLQMLKWFFGLPLEEKMKVAKKSYNSANKNIFRGYTPMQMDKDITRETFHVDGSTPLPDDDPERMISGTDFYEDTPYPLLEQEEGKKFRTTIESVHEVLVTTCKELLHLFALGLGMEEDAFDSQFFPKSLSNFRLIYAIGYSTDDYAPKDGLNCVAHTDASFITLLTSYGNPGLQVESSDGSWLDLTSRPGSFIVNIGLLLSRITNHRFKATEHRVKKIENDRYSTAFFLEPRANSEFFLPDDSSTIVYGQWMTEKLYMRGNSKVEFKGLLDYKSPLSAPK